MSFCNDIVDLKGLPQKSSDFYSLFKGYSLCASFCEIIKALKKIPPNFTIITKNNKYKCHLEIIAAVSNLIFKAIQSDPTINQFSLNEDFNDSKFDQFILFLNGNNVKINDNNRTYFQSLANFLQIDKNCFDVDNQDEISLNRFSRHFQLVLPDLPKPIIISTEKDNYPVNYLIALAYSQLLNQTITDNSNQLKINLQASEDISEFIEFLNYNSISVNVENYNALKEFLSELKITLLDDPLDSIMSSFQFLMPTLAITNLQDTVFDLNDTNVSEIHKLLSKSEFYLNTNLHFDLLLTLELSFTYRPVYFENVFKLISLLENEDFHKSLIKYLFIRILSYQLSVPFLRCLYDFKIISHQELIKLIKTDLNIDINSDYTFNMKKENIKNDLLIFFAKDFYEFDPDGFVAKINKSNQFFSRGSRPFTDLQPYVDNWDDYEKTVSMHNPPNSLYIAILKDDADSFQKITSQQGDFNFNKPITQFLFERSSALYSPNITYSDLAAFYGAISCFRFLILQGADISKSAGFAIMGGNTEIIRLIEQEGADFSHLHHWATIYHRNDIFKWLLMNHGPIECLYKGEYRCKSEPIIPKAIESYNHRVLLYYYEQGIDNQQLDESLSLLGMAVQSLNIEAIRLLLKTYLVDVNKTHPRMDTPPILHAVANDCLEAVKVLVELGKCEIPKNKYNPLMYAIKHEYVDIIEYLAPLYTDVIDDNYINSTSNEKVKEILLSAKK